MPIRYFIQILSAHETAIPKEIPLSRKERTAFKDPKTVFADLATACEIPSLKRFLKKCSQSPFYAIELNGWDKQPTDAYFRFMLDGSHPAVRLPTKSKAIKKFPPLLQKLYSSIGGLQDDNFEFAGGILDPDSVCPMAEAGFWFDEEQEISPAECSMFMTSFCGDVFGFDRSGNAILYDHEIGKLEKCGTLKSLLDKYFKGLLDGSKM